MLGDPAFREAVCDAQGVLRHTVTISGSGETKVVEIEQVQATSGVPGFAKKIVGNETTIQTEERWSSPTAAAQAIKIPGKPGEMNGTICLSETGDGVVETVDLAISVGIPFVGGKLESLLADLMLAALKNENQTGRTWLGR